MKAKSPRRASSEDVRPAVEFASLFAFGDHGAVTRGREECRNAGAAGADAFGQRALGIQLDL